MMNSRKFVVSSFISLQCSANGPVFSHVVPPVIVSSRQYHAKRLVSTSNSNRTAVSPIVTVAPTLSTQNAGLPGKTSSSSPLASLPLFAVIRSYLIMSLSASPAILNVGLYGLRKMLNARSAVSDVDRNPLLRWLFKKTFYAQFCAGENVAEVQECMKTLENIGYQGIVLEYASEVLADGDPTAEKIEADIETWRTGCIDSIAMARPGDLVAMKWSGMGCEALRLLKENSPPSEPMYKAMTDICEFAVKRGVGLLPAAEPQNANAAVDQWSLDLAARYNKNELGHAVIYNTYQCYLKSTPETLAKHLSHAAKNNYTLGIKLVRGAYLATEKRDLIWDTIEETHNAYDEVAKQCIEKQWGGLLQLPAGEESNVLFPNVNVMLATHNLASVKKGIELRKVQINKGIPVTRMCFAQLQGMADEVSCELVQDSCYLHEVKGVSKENLPKIFKYVTWGTTGQCLHYLFRRAEENKDAIGRTKQTSRAMGKELARRFKGWFHI